MPRERIRASDPVAGPKAAKRVQSAGMRHCASDYIELGTRMNELAKIGRKMAAGPQPVTHGLPRTLVDDKLDAIIAERNTAHGDVSTHKVARVYDLPHHLVEVWLEDHPDEHAGLYDEDCSQPAAHRNADERDDPASFSSIPRGLGRPFYRSGLPDGRPVPERDVAKVIEDASGFTVERCRGLLRRGHQRAHQPANQEWMDVPAEREKVWLGMMLANVVKRGEATRVAIAGTLEVNRHTIGKLIADGDFEPVPYMGAPTVWQPPQREPMIERKRTPTTREYVRRQAEYMVEP
jgi:hypothetical protein